MFLHPRLANRFNRLDQDTQQIVGADADFVAGQTNDAGVAGPEHLDLRATTQPELR